MLSPAQAALLSWSIPPAATFALVLTALIYLRGWMLMCRARVPFVPAWRAGCFLLGIFALWFALASPLDTFSGFLLTAHMLQHMVLILGTGASTPMKVQSVTVWQASAAANMHN